MKFLLASSALAAAFAIAPAYAQQTPKPPITAESATQGTVTVEGIEPSQVLGAIDTSKLVDQPAPADEQPQVQAQAQAKTQVTVDETTVQTADAKVETKVETITPVSGRPTLDPETPIAPEVQAVVDSGKKYTTADIVLAQLEAIKNTPPVNPTTTITTTTTTPTPTEG
ncbi:MAG: hypothetical protein Q8R02_20435 [Hyphomonadaceae bacterium]|nr:hypothetical protein [Hyphomonadaceae bacterium]